MTQFPITSRVAEPEVLARHLRFSANGVTARRLGVVSAANEAGNPVLADAVAWLWVTIRGQPSPKGRYHPQNLMRFTTIPKLW